MPQITSPLTSPPGMPGFNRAGLARVTGLFKHLTRAEFDTAVTDERTNIIGGAGLYQAGERLYIIGEEGYRVWSIGADAATSHAKTVAFASGKRLTLTSDANTVTSVTGTPTGGVDGNVAIDWTTGLMWTRTSGVWVNQGTGVGAAFFPASAVVPFTLSGSSGVGQVVTATLAAGYAYDSVQWKRNTSGTVVSASGAGATTLAYTQVAADVAAGVNVYPDFANLRFISAGLTGGSVVVGPGQVTGLTLGSTTSTSQGLFWTAPTGSPDDYVIQRSPAGANTWTTFARAASTYTFGVVTGLASNTAYDYRVAASAGGVPGTYSAVVSASTSATSTPPALLAGWVNDTDPTKVYTLWSRKLTSVPSVAGLTLAGKTISGAVAAGVEGTSLVVITVTAGYAPGVAPTLSYIPPGSNAIASDSGIAAQAITSLVLENLIGSTTPVAADLTNRQSGLTDVSAGLYTAATGPKYALLPVKIPEGGSGWVELEISSANNYATSLALTSTYSLELAAQATLNYFALTTGAAVVSRSLNSSINSSVSYTVTLGTDTKMRIRRDAVAKSITLDTFTSGAWVTRYTYQGYQDNDLFIVVGVYTSGKQLLNPQTVGAIAV